MRKLDYRHIIYHVLIALYFIWLAVFAVLVAMALVNFYAHRDYSLNELFVSLMLMNLFMGTILFGVIRLYRRRSLLDRVIAYSFAFMAGTAVTALLMLKQ